MIRSANEVRYLEPYKLKGSNYLEWVMQVTYKLTIMSCYVIRVKIPVHNTDACVHGLERTRPFSDDGEGGSGCQCLKVVVSKMQQSLRSRSNFVL